MAKIANILPVYLAVGDDELKRKEVIKRLRARLEEDGDLSFDADDFNGETASGMDVVTACNTVSFFAPRRLVVVEYADKLRKADTDALVEYVKDPNSDTVLALSAQKLAKNTRLYKAIDALGKGAIIDCATPKGYDLQKMVVKFAASQGARMTEGAASYLISCVGTDTVYLNNEVQKLALACNDVKTITEREVETFVEATVEVKPWNFLKPFTAHNVEESLRWLNESRGVSPMALAPMCANRLRELMCAKVVMQHGGGENALLEELNIAKRESWKVKDHVRYARSWSIPQLKNALVTLRDCEQAMKSESDDKGEFSTWVLEALTFR